MGQLHHIFSRQIIYTLLQWLATLCVSVRVRVFVGTLVHWTYTRQFSIFVGVCAINESAFAAFSDASGGLADTPYPGESLLNDADIPEFALDFLKEERKNRNDTFAETVVDRFSSALTCIVGKVDELDNSKPAHG